VTAEQIADSFDLGTPLRPMAEAARGWGGLNVVYRLDTNRGSWAVKAMVRELDDLHAERLEIELAAWERGISMPRPVVGPDGQACAGIDGTTYRCHEWVAGRAKENEGTTAAEAEQMGYLVASLHGLALPFSPRFDEQHDQHADATWASLAEAGAARGAVWAGRLVDELDTVAGLASDAQRTSARSIREGRIASHRDLNAHNVLFGPAGLSLIDWDGAGPIVPVQERSQYAVLWAARDRGRYDLDAVVAFLRGYRAADGEIADDDPEALGSLLVNVEDWTRKNVRWAVESPSPDQDQAAGYLIAALLATPDTIEVRKALLARAIAQL